MPSDTVGTALINITGSQSRLLSALGLYSGSVDDTKLSAAVAMLLEVVNSMTSSGVWSLDRAQRLITANTLATPALPADTTIPEADT